MVSELILDEAPLTEPYAPERLLHREGVVREIISALSPVLKNRTSENILVYGDSGTGKTSVIKSILQKHFESSFVYVNCWNVRSRHKILSEILLQMNQMVHGRESIEELTKIFERVPKKRLVVCLDEADQLRDTSILYNLARNSVAVILIANSEFFLAELDPRVSSSLWLRRVEFKKYSATELTDILSERVEYSLKPGAIDDHVIHIISTVANGDARVALQTLRTAARLAERKGSAKISIDEMRGAVREARLSKRAYLITKLNPNERLLYGILEARGKTKSGTLYQDYRKQVDNPLQERAYRENMERLAEKGLVIALGTGRGRSYAING